ncbi:hypothetical protein CK203_056173 [Vitis vinifera]|uniref:Uncharacterized protein n=1 Tax=Vitis vinifera TaxID=29760 RepID=A0A438GE47_VITVI|nr:hypothetical protein CK203_056173 [Vitis vinifera]
MPLASTFARIWKSGHQLEGRNMGEQAEPFLGGVRFLGLNSSRFLSAFKDTMLPRRPASSQNSQANDDIPPPPEALPPLIDTEEEKELKFQDGLKPYLKNKISILKLSVYSKVVDRALIAEKDNEELH